jgi:hypothetical protein
MAQAPLPKSEYPDVPQADGVPALFRDPQVPVFTAVLLVADAITVANMFQGPQWGIFTNDGFPRIVPDSIISLDYRREWRLSDYPIEEGSFEHYNKVNTPYEARVRMACSGLTSPRNLFLSILDGIADDLNTYTIVTPDAQYSNANITHYDYRRVRENGVSLLLVDIWLQEVRINVKTEFTSTKSPEGASTINTGSVQATTPTPSQAQSVGSARNSGSFVSDAVPSSASRLV